MIITIGLLMVTGMAAALYAITKRVMIGVRSDAFQEKLQEVAEELPHIPTDITPFLMALPGVLMLGAFLFLIFMSFSNVLSALYLSKDLEMLMAWPVPVHVIFINKMVQAALSSSPMTFFFFGAILFGYGSGMEYGYGYMIMVIVGLLLLPFIPYSLSAIIILPMMRVLPARLVHKVVSVTGGIVTITFYFLFVIARPEINTLQMATFLLDTQIAVLPPVWLGNALVAVGTEDWQLLIHSAGIFFGATILLFGTAVMLSTQYYYSGWNTMMTHDSGIRMKRRALPRNFYGSATMKRLMNRAALASPQITAVFFKDWQSFPRDLRNLQQIIPPATLAIIWLFRTFIDSDSGMSSESSVWAAETDSVFSMIIFLSICSMFSSILAGSGIGREGKTFWLMKLAPVRSMDILVGKLILAYLPFPILGSVFLVLEGVIHGQPWYRIVSYWVLLQILGVGTTSLSLGMGAYFPDMEWENPQKQSTVLAGCLTALIIPFYIMISIFAFIVIPLVGEAVITLLSLSTTMTITMMTIFYGSGWVATILLMVLVVRASLAIGAHGIERLEL